ncbi:MAG: phospholipase D-like domain-containing protein [Gemmatimonadaceae bacterium]|nr:phospholipase D-like domain-containing protein [Gemmatimonadaceae bacterium]
MRADRAYVLAARLAQGAADPDFRTLVEQIDGMPLVPADATRLYTDGADATAAVARAIESARHEVLVETYILRDDRIGWALVDLLRAAVARGVRCHVLADAVGSWGARRAFWRALADAGVVTRRFHPLSLDLVNSFRRDHRKLVIVDRAVAFTGGMNIGAEYGSSLRSERRTRWWRRWRSLGATRPDAYRDTLARFDGPVASQLAAVFAEGWHRAGGAPMPALEQVAWSDDAGAPAVPLPLREVHTESNAACLILDARPGRGQPETIAVLAAALGAARARAWITTPYFAPPDAALTLLADAVQRGVDVRLLLPGMSDVPVMRWAARGAYARLLASGVRLFEYQPAVLHAKTLVVDDALSLVGSANLDYRSFWFNAECTVLVFDAVLAGAMAQSFRDDLADAHEVTADAWHRVPWWWKVMAWGARQCRWVL